MGDSVKAANAFISTLQLRIFIAYLMSLSSDRKWNAMQFANVCATLLPRSTFAPSLSLRCPAPGPSVVLVLVLVQCAFGDFLFVASNWFVYNLDTNWIRKRTARPAGKLVQLFVLASRRRRWKTGQKRDRYRDSVWQREKERNGNGTGKGCTSQWAALI